MAISPVRVALAVVALVLAGWFALNARESHAVDQVTAILATSGHVGPAAAARANGLLDTASTLNPDREVQILRGRLQLAEGNLAVARQTLQGVVEAEPENLEAWFWLAASSSGNRSELKRALAHIFALDPRLRATR